MKQKVQTKNRLYQGMSLIELMVALTLSLMVSLAIGTLFIQNRMSYSQNEEIGYIQDNGRYALKALANELEMMDFWGGYDDPSLLAVRNYAITNSCETLSWHTLFPVTPVAGGAIVNRVMKYQTQTGSGYPCATGDFKTSPVTSDFLMVKRLRGQPITSGQETGRLYLRTDLANIRHFYLFGAPAGTYEAAVATLNGTDWEYKYHLFYIDQNHQLIRQTLVPGATYGNLAMRRDVIVEGIEYFHIVYGLDSDRDGQIDQYTSNVSDAQSGYVYSAQVYVLARSKRPMEGYTNAKSYQLGDIYFPSQNDGTVASNDSFYRRVYSTSVVLRNTYIISRLTRL